VSKANELFSLIFQLPGMKFDWSQELQGYILSSFYIGYIITHIPGAMLAHRFGGKYVLAFGILLTAFMSLITPIITKSWGAPALMVTRFLMGLFQGPLFPAISALLSAWVPTKERARLCSLAFSGMTVN
jgi:ACS family sodium-dependent inorganic phosphate cotransporter